MQTYTGPVASLHPAVQFLVAMHSIPRLSEKLQVMVDLGIAHLDLDCAATDVDTLSLACEDVCDMMHTGCFDGRVGA